MSESLPQAILDSSDIMSITQLIVRERECRDWARWDEMRACFFPDSLVRISWFRGNGPDFVTGSIDMARRNIRAKHRLSPILVRLSGDRALASMTGIIDLPVTLKGVEFNLATYSRFLYRVERRNGRWGIMGFDAIYMRDELTPAIPGQSITIDKNELKDFRPTYRMLSYYLASQGYAVDSNLAGEDRPDLVEALERELFEWAGIARNS
jgi:SnoaL-like domain